MRTHTTASHKDLSSYTCTSYFFVDGHSTSLLCSNATLAIGQGRKEGKKWTYTSESQPSLLSKPSWLFKRSYVVSANKMIGRLRILSISSLAWPPRSGIGTNWGSKLFLKRLWILSFLRDDILLSKKKKSKRFIVGLLGSMRPAK